MPLETGSFLFLRSSQSFSPAQTKSSLFLLLNRGSSTGAGRDKGDEGCGAGARLEALLQPARQVQKETTTLRVSPLLQSPKIK